MQPDVVGRGAELAAVERVLTRASQEPAALVLQGEPGIGKTTLWTAARTLASERGFQVLSSRPTASESGLPLGAFGDLFADVSPDIAARLSDPQRHALEVALLRADPTGIPSHQRALSVATANLLRELADLEGPVLIAIDDVQWLDESSARILSFALRRIDGRRIGVVVSLRGIAPGPAPLGLDVAMPSGAVERRTLGPLSLGELHRLLLTHLGQSFSRLGLIRIEEACAGNPFYALEIARALIRTGATVTPGEPLPIPDELAPLMRERIEALPEQTREGLLLAAMAFEPSLAVLSRAAGTDVTSVLDPAVRDDLVAVERGTVRFSHPLLAAAVLARADPSVIRDVHAQLARVVSSDEARARHLGLAANAADEAAADALEVAAESARSRGAPIAAAQMLERARDLTAPDRRDKAASRIYLAARCHFEAGETQRARTLLEEQVRSLEPGPRRAPSLQLLAQVLARSSSFQDAVTIAQQALFEAGDDAALRAGIELDIAYGSVCLGDMGGAVPHAAASAALAEGAGISGLQAEAVGALVMLGFLGGGGLDESGMARALALEDPRRSSPLELHPRFVHGLLLLWSTRLDEAIVTLGKLRAEAIDQGQETVVPSINFYLVLGSLWRGNMRDAAGFAEESRDVASLIGDPVTNGLALTAGALVDAYAGIADRARARAGEALVLFQQSQWTLYLTWPLTALGFLEVSLGNAAGADELLRPLAEAITSMPSGDPILGVCLPDEIDALLALGEFERATPLIEWLERGGAAQDRPWALAIAARCRGSLAAAQGDLGSAIVALDQAAVQHERLAMPFERARTLLVRGRVHRRRKEKRLADEALREAQAIFADCEATLWMQHASTELSRIGLRPRAPRDLTETERRVAMLAASGMTNREVAQAAFLSPKTIDNVLGRVYRKLDIGSRAELGAVMARDQ
jgi:DNA-binding CsgD family transcriptional regulator/tetratricopeptide (TPR) repeat protein